MGVRPERRQPGRERTGSRVIAISMLTLRPGRMGGSETYARGLARALAEHGSLDYRCLVPAGAEDAAEGLPLAKELEGVAAVHYPFTRLVPATKLPFAVTLHDLLHREAAPAPMLRRLIRRYTYDRGARRA